MEEVDWGHFSKFNFHTEVAIGQFQLIRRHAYGGS